MEAQSWKNRKRETTCFEMQRTVTALHEHCNQHSFLHSSALKLNNKKFSSLEHFKWKILSEKMLKVLRKKKIKEEKKKAA